jgi:Hypothetical glycosyl hydrolase family 15
VIDCGDGATAVSLGLMTATNGLWSSRWGVLLRRGWMTVLLVGLTVILAVAGAACGRAPPSPIAPGHLARTAAVRTFSSALDEAEVRATTKAQWETIARDNTVVVLNSWDFGLIPVLRQANPRIQVWVYKDLSGIRSDDCATVAGECGTCARGLTDKTLLSSGMGYCWVIRNHPDWLLRADGTGQPFEFQGYPHTWETDYGNRAYQDQWIRNVLADVRTHGWDGVEVDNALTRADVYGVAAKYATNAAVQAATYSALQRVGPALQHAGVAAVFNVGYATMFPGLWQRWLGPVQGLEQEFYLSYSTQPNALGVSVWGWYQDEVSSCAVRRKSCWFHSGGYSTAVTSRTRQYALASYLLAADGRQLLAVGDTRSGRLAPLWPLGAPLSSAAQLGPARARYFAGGIAVANPSRSRVAVYLGGTYLDDGGHLLSTVTLGPASGTVLRLAPGQGHR